MSINEILPKLAVANPATLERISDLLEGRMVDGSVNVELITISDAARMCKLSRNVIHKLVDDGRLPSVKLTGNRRIPRQAVIDFALAGYNKTCGKRGASVSFSA